ncbi:heat shock protein 70 family [Auriculariales sp. MPI-PUGE-AT-0066]|nr:heat shock protein 70 family [Auriculariales sp. MPI-PUGE-AT-0066]
MSAFIANRIRFRRRTIASSVMFAILVFIGIIAFCPTVARAEQTQKPLSEDSGPIIGIGKLFLAYSCVAVALGNKVEIIVNDQGNRITPSWVSFNENERLIGDAAKHAFHSNPQNTVFDAKRLIGRHFSDSEVHEDAKNWPFKVVDRNNKPLVEVEYRNETRQFGPEEISAMVLTKMKETAEAFLGRPVSRAVITVPAYFNDAQRQATKDAGTIAGLNVVRIINEPTAAALAYGLGAGAGSPQPDQSGERRVVVYDLGGGTFDVSLLSIEDGVFEVLATSGDTHLGAKISTRHSKKANLATSEVRKDPKAMSKLRRAVENAKRILSSQLTARLEIDSFYRGQDLSETLTRATFESLNADLFRRTMAPVKQVLKDAGLDKSEITDIVLVGGSTRIPKVQQLLHDFFGKEPSQRVNPDEAVAYGAAVQGAILNGDLFTKDIGILDTTALTLGIETVGGMFTKIIPRNEKIPTKKTQIFSTAADNQAAVNIRVFEGERGMTADNMLLGNFELAGIPPAPRGVPQIEVTFTIDSNGIVSVTAADKGTGNEKSVTIRNENGRLSQEEIDRMIREAEEFADQDNAQRLRVEALNAFSQSVGVLKTQVADATGLGGKLGDRDKAALKAEIKEAEEWLEREGSNAEHDELEERRAQFQAAVGPITSKLYAAGGGEEDDESHFGHDPNDL